MRSVNARGGLSRNMEMVDSYQMSPACEVEQQRRDMLLLGKLATMTYKIDKQRT